MSTYYDITGQKATGTFLEQNQDRINGIAKANNVDLNTAQSMFISNITRGTSYAGGGVANISDLNKAYTSSLSQNTGNSNTGTSSYTDQIAQALAQQKAAEEAAIKAQTEATVGSIEAYRPQVQSSYEDAARQAYINQMRSQGSLKDVLAAQGYSGGMSETANLGLSSEYNAALGTAQQTKQSAETEIERMIAEARLTGNTDLASSMASYYQNYVANLQNQQEQSNYMSELQTQQQQTAYDNAYKLYAQGIRTAGVLKALGIEDAGTVATTGGGTNKGKTTVTGDKKPTGIDWSDDDINKLSAGNQRNVAMLITQYKSKKISEADFIKRMKALGVNAGYTY